MPSKQERGGESRLLRQLMYQDTKVNYETVVTNTNRT